MKNIKNIIIALGALLLVGGIIFALNYESIMHQRAFDALPATPPPEKVNWFADFGDWITGTETISAEDYQK